MPSSCAPERQGKPAAPGPEQPHSSGAALRTDPTSPASTAGAALPQLLRMKVSTEATCPSSSDQPNDGIAGAVGAASVAAPRLPSSTSRTSVCGSLAWTLG